MLASSAFRRSFPLCALLLALLPITLRAADAPRPGWWRDAVFYEIFVRSFADARTGPLAGDGVGDLQGLMERLDYLNDGRGADSKSLGVTALWLMPVQSSPTYHGYDVSDYFAVDPEYGDVALMRRLVAEAHRRGIRVIVDFVLNHCSWDHPLFVDATSGGPKAAAARPYFRFAPVPENLKGPWDQRVWHPRGEEYYYGIFDSHMPDWNFRHPAVTEHHRRAAEFWLREVGVDGFRLDAVRYFYEQGDTLQDTAETRRWLAEFTAFCHSVKPGAFIIGENTADMHEVARSLQEGALDSAFEFDLARATLEAIRLRSGGLLRETLQRLARLHAMERPVATFLTNHDQERVITQLGGNEAATRFAAELLFTLPGVPFIYYGEEIGVAGAKPDPELRMPMPWSAEPNAGFAAASVKPWHAVAADFRQVNVAAQEAKPDSLLALYRRLIRLHQSSPALRGGTPVEVMLDDARGYAVLRQTADEAVLVLANFFTAEKPAPVLSAPSTAVRGDWRLSEELRGAKPRSPTLNAQGGFTKWQPLERLAPQSVYVLRWRR